MEPFVRRERTIVPYQATPRISPLGPCTARRTEPVASIFRSSGPCRLIAHGVSAFL